MVALALAQVKKIQALVQVASITTTVSGVVLHTHKMSCYQHLAFIKWFYLSGKLRFVITV